MTTIKQKKLKPEEEEASWDYAELWDKFPVPARPSTEELKFLYRELKPKGKDIKVLILGSTIEYRSLCKKLGISPYVADFDKTIYEKLTNYSKEKFKNETFIKKDWLDINKPKQYDAIIGHRPYNVLGKTTLNKFFKGMFSSLKEGGVFYCKGNINIDTKKSLESLRKKWAFKNNRRYPLFSYLETYIYIHCANKDGYVDYPKARKIVNTWYKNDKISTKDYKLMKILVSMSSEARFRGKISKNEIIKVLKKSGCHKTKWITLDKDICKNMPIIIISK